MPATTPFRSRTVGSIDLLPAEGHQLAGESGGPRARLLDFRDVRLARVVRIEIRQQQLAMPQDLRQQVVEVVRHAAGQQSDRLHFLRLEILLLQRPAIGDVQGSPDTAQRLAVLAELDPSGTAQPPHRAVGPHRSMVEAEIDAGFRRVRKRLEHHRAIVGMNALDERLDRAGKRTGLQAVLDLDGLGPAERPADVVQVPDSNVGVLESEPHALFSRFAAPRRRDSAR